MNKIKTLPNAIDLEEKIIGFCQISQNIDNVLDLITKDYFFDISNQIIFEHITLLKSQNKPCDTLSLYSELKKSNNIENVGGIGKLTKTTETVVGSDSIQNYCMIIKEKYILRRLNYITSNLYHKTLEETTDCFDLLESLERDLTGIHNNFNISKTIPSLKQLWIDIKENNKHIIENKGVIGVNSGFIHIDRITGGWQKSALIIIGARPAMGKTSFMLNIARNCSMIYKKKCLIFSLEMPSLQLSQRLFSMETEISNTSFMRRGLDYNTIDLIDKNNTGLINSPIYIDDSSSSTIADIKRKSRKMYRDIGIDIIMVDYLQLMSSENKHGKNREQEISEISRGLKLLAKELNIPIIALSQLSRETEKRTDKRPILSDIRESGSLEQDADVVCFIHRPEYYGVKEYSDGTTTNGIAEIIFAKNRNGGIGVEKLRWIDYLTKFEDIQQENKPFVNHNINNNVNFYEKTEENNDDYPF